MVLGLTLAYVVAEIAGGLLTHSLALLADAGHMFTDALGRSMARAAVRFAQRPATSQKTCGFYRTQILVALARKSRQHCVRWPACGPRTICTRGPSPAGSSQ